MGMSQRFIYKYEVDLYHLVYILVLLAVELNFSYDLTDVNKYMLHLD